MVVHRIKDIITGEYATGSYLNENIDPRIGKIYMEKEDAQKYLDKMENSELWEIVTSEIKDI